ncbi:helix-turn-helix domain-containing protein [Candidatus Latescibacterota bacterium]
MYDPTSTEGHITQTGDEQDMIPVIVILNDEEDTGHLTVLVTEAGMRVGNNDDLPQVLRSLRSDATIILMHADRQNNHDILKYLTGTHNATHNTSCFLVNRSLIAGMPEEYKNIFHLPVKKHKNMKTLEEIEKEHIIRILDESSWVYKSAAKILGINRTTLYRKLRKYGLPDKKA